MTFLPSFTRAKLPNNSERSMTAFSNSRVVITGMGLVCPLASELASLWQQIQQGHSGITPLECLPTQSLQITAGAQVKDFTGAIEDYGPLDKSLQRLIKKNMKVMCREIEMGVAAAQKALTHSGLGERNSDRCGCLFGCDYILTRPEEYADGVISCLNQREKQTGKAEFDVADWPAEGLFKVNPLWLLKYLPNMPNSHVSIYNDFRGPNNSITVREASMNLSLAEATSIIHRGAADVMLVGATGSRLHPLRTTVETLRAQLASQRDNPDEMSRPFDSSADGMVLGEGAGALILESWEHAQRRGAKVWGEIVGSGSAMVGPGNKNTPPRDFLRESIRNALRSAIQSAGDRLPEKWHLHAHGLSMPDVDASEAQAISDVFGQFGQMPVVAAKSYFGNLGAGSGAVELICSLLALHYGQLFPIRNLATPSAHATWSAATAGSEPGQAVVHSSFTLQGQASTIAVVAA